jgi:RNA polymerase sigma-70 factor (ECF subfamily)
VTDTIAQEQALSVLGDGLLIIALRALADADDARDAVQETLLRVLAVLHGRGLPASYSLESYAYGTLRHVIADAQRARRRSADLPGALSARDASPLEALVSAETLTELERALASLNPEDRELLYRCFVNGERVVAIAAATGEPPDRIRKRKSRALERLRGHVLRTIAIE